MPIKIKKDVLTAFAKTQQMRVAAMNRIKEEVEESGGLKSVSMADLREAYGRGRLGVHVVRGIASELSGVGLGHYPLVLPQKQSAMVRLYKRGTKAEDVIKAMLTPGEEGDEILQETIETDAEEVLRQVREIVCG